MTTKEALEHFETEVARLRASALRNLHEQRAEIDKINDQLNGSGYVQPGIAGTFVRSDYLERAHGDLARLWTSLEAVEMVDNIHG